MPHRIVVGIAGGSASGKSTIANALSDTLQHIPGRRVLILASDRYVNPDSPEGPTFFSQTAGEVMFDWNHPHSVGWDRLLRDLDMHLHQVDGPNIIIVEGLMVFHEPALRSRMDLRLFVELDADERALRRMIRNMDRKGMNNDPQFIANYYRESARIGHARYVEPSRVYADLIVRGDADWSRIQPMLLAVIEDRLHSRI